MINLEPCAVATSILAPDNNRTIILYFISISTTTFGVWRTNDSILNVIFHLELNEPK